MFPKNMYFNKITGFLGTQHIFKTFHHHQIYHTSTKIKLLSFYYMRIGKINDPLGRGQF
jgi:hypothetical protein